MTPGRPAAFFLVLFFIAQASAANAATKTPPPKPTATIPLSPKKIGPPKVPPLPKTVQRLIKNRRYQKLADALEAQTSDFGGRRAFLLGHSYLMLKRHTDALHLMRRALRQMPELRNQILHFIALAARGAKDLDAERKALEELVRRDPGGDLAPDALKALTDIALQQGKPLRAAEWLRMLLRHFPKHEKAPEFLIQRAKALEQAGKRREAALAWRRLWLRYPQSPKADQALELSRQLGQDAKPPLRQFGPRDFFLRARKLHKSFHYEKALQAYRQLNQLFPNSAFQREIALYESLTLYSLRRTEKARTALGDALHLFSSGSPARAQVRFYISRNHLRRHDHPAFDAEAKTLLDETPRGKWAARTRFLLARVSEDSLEYETAARFYENVVQKHPLSSFAPKARWQLSWIRLQKKDYAGAHRGFEEMARLYPNHRLVSSALYWGAVAAERAGEREKAEALYRKCAQIYRHRYYGQLAKTALGRMARKSGLSLKPLIPPSAGFQEWTRPPNGSTTQTQRRRWLAAEQLASMGFHVMAAREFKRLGSALYFRYRVARSYLRGEQHDMAIRIMHASFWDAVRSGGRDLPSEFWEIAFPLQAKQKRAGDADPMLVNAIIKAESLFDRLAFSKAGAIGLMQLMPATGRRMAKKLSIRLESNRQLFDPNLNVRLGARHLGDLVREFKGELIPAIASYNAGKRVVKKWWKNRGNESIETFIERIPYQETRNYVKKVLGYLHEYRRIYANRTKPQARTAK